MIYRVIGNSTRCYSTGSWSESDDLDALPMISLHGGELRHESEFQFPVRQRYLL